MTEVAEKRFYVLRAVSGKEAKVREQLEAEMKNTNLGQYVSQVVIPTEKIVTQRAGKKVIKERPYLPGYVLVEAALLGDVAHTLRNMPNVIGFLGANKGGEPEPLKRSEVERILGVQTRWLTPKGCTTSSSTWATWYVSSMVLSLTTRLPSKR